MKLSIFSSRASPNQFVLGHRIHLRSGYIFKKLWYQFTEKSLCVYLGAWVLTILATFFAVLNQKAIGWSQDYSTAAIFTDMVTVAWLDETHWSRYRRLFINDSIIIKFHLIIGMFLDCTNHKLGWPKKVHNTEFLPWT